MTRLIEVIPTEAEVEAFVERAMTDLGRKSMLSVAEAVGLGLFSRSELYRRGPSGTGEIEWRKCGKAARILTRSLLEAAARLPRVVSKARTPQ